jgi:tetratricopeptide (TPR) repeat protein
LVSEAASAAAPQGARVLWARCYESERILSFGPWLTALRRDQVLHDADLKLRLSSAWRDELAWLIPELAPPYAAANTSPTDDRRVFEAIQHLIAQVAIVGPVVFIFEDLQWVDDMSMRLLAFLVRRLDSSDVLFIATVRNEDVDQDSLLQRTLNELVLIPAVSVLELQALCQSDALALVQSHAIADGSGAPTAPLANQVCEASQGSPFLIIEIMRALHEGTALFGTAGLPLPKRVEDVVNARIQRLTEISRSLIAVAAVIGHACDFTVLARAAQLPEQQIAGAVEEMVRRRILHAIGDRIEFTHDWIRETVYASILAPHRRLLHEHVAAAWEATCSMSWDRILPTIVFHYRLAQVWDKTVYYARKAGEQALARCAYPEASALFEQAQLALRSLPSTPEVILESIDVRVDLHRALVPTGVAGRTIENLREAEKLNAIAGDTRRGAQLSLYLSEYFRTTGDYEQAVAYAQRVVVAAREYRGAELLTEANFHLGQTKFWRGEYRSAIDLLRQSLDPTQGHRSSSRCTVAGPVAVSSRCYIAWALAFLGDFAQATNVANTAIDTAEVIDEPFGQVEAYRALGVVLVEKGEFAKGVRLLEEALRVCQAWHTDLLYSLAASTLGYAYAITGNFAEGIPLMERAIEQRASLRGDYPGSMGAYLLTRLAHGYLSAGRTAEAVSVTGRAYQLADSYDNRVDEACSLRLYGDIAAQRDPPDSGEAELRYQRSRAIAAALEMHPFVAQCDLRLGSLFQRIGRTTKSHAALRAAHTAFTNLDMPFWAERSQEMLAKLAMSRALTRSHRDLRVTR